MYKIFELTGVALDTLKGNVALLRYCNIKFSYIAFLLRILGNEARGKRAFNL